MYTMSKLINVSDDVYETLSDLKGKESYSQVIRTLLVSHRSNKEKILEFFGKGGIDERKIKELNPLWKKWSLEYA